METTTITHWLTGQDDVSCEPTLVRDGIWAVKSWRYLQKEPSYDSHWPFMLLAICVFASFILPVLAWGAEIPVLSHNLRRGEIITAADVATRTMPDEAIPPQAIRKGDELIGKEAFRPIRGNVPIYSSYVRTPPTVRKNSLVDLIFKAPGMTVQSTGKALEDGSTGHSVKLLNTDSGRIVSGEVLKNGSVLIQ